MVEIGPGDTEGETDTGDQETDDEFSRRELRRAKAEASMVDDEQEDAGVDLSERERDQRQERRVRNIQEPGEFQATPSAPERVSAQELRDAGVTGQAIQETREDLSRRVSGLQSDEVIFTRQDGQIRARGEAGFRDQEEFDQALRRARRRQAPDETRLIRAGKRATPGAGITRTPTTPAESVRARSRETDAIREVREATPGPGIGLSRRERERRQRIQRAEDRAATNLISTLEERVPGERFSVAGFERGEEFEVTRRQGDPVGRLQQAIVTGELLERGPEQIGQEIARETRALETGQPIIETELTPTGRRRFTTQKLLAQGEIEFDEQTATLPGIGELSVTPTREVKTPAQLEFGDAGQLEDVEEAPEVLNVRQGSLLEQGAKGTIATLDFGAEKIAEAGDVVEDVTFPVIESTRALPTVTNPLGVFGTQEQKEFSETVRKGAVGGVTDIFRLPEAGLDVTRAGTEAAIFTGTQIAEEGPVEGLGTAGTAGAAVGGKLARQVGIASAKQPVRTAGTLVGGSAVGAAVSPVRFSRFDVPVEGGGTQTLRGVRVTSPKILEGRVDRPGTTLVGARGKRPTRGAPSVDPERIDFERLGEFGPEIDPTGRFETDVLRATAGRVGPEAQSRFEAAESVAAEGTKTSPGLELTSTEEIVRQARDVPEGAAGPVAEALQDVDAEIFGSAAVRSQIPEARTPRDVDIAVEDKSAAKQRLGEALEGTDAEVADVFDIKEKSELPRPGEVAKFGRLAKERLETDEGVKVTQAGEELLKKAGGSVFLRPRGTPAPDAPGTGGVVDVGPGTRGGGTFVRVKDPADVGIIGAGMARTTGLGRVSPRARRRARVRAQKVEEFREEFESELQASVAEQPELMPPRPVVSRGRLRQLASEERAQVTLGGRRRGQLDDVDTGVEPRDIDTESSVARRRGFDPTVPIPTSLISGRATTQPSTVSTGGVEGVSPAPTGPTQPSQVTTAQPTSPVSVPDIDTTTSPISTPDSPTTTSPTTTPTTPVVPGLDSPVSPVPPTTPTTTPTTPPPPPTFGTPGDTTTTRPVPDVDEDERRFGVAGFNLAEKEFASEVATAETVLEGDIETLGEVGAFTPLRDRTTEPGTQVEAIATGDPPEKIEQEVNALETS